MSCSQLCKVEEVEVGRNKEKEEEEVAAVAVAVVAVKCVYSGSKGLGK